MDFPAELFTHERVQWISGGRLREIVEAPPYQLVWGRLLAFAPEMVGRVAGRDIPGPEPYIGRQPAHTLSVIEIVAFDSTSTEGFARDTTLAAKLAASFPEGTIHPQAR